MTNYKILMSNLGYFRGINGALAQHLAYAHRHFYCSTGVQKKAVLQLMQLLEKEKPDICCFVEIDQGSSNSANFNQLEALVSEHYPHFDIENKYGHTSRLRALSMTRGKSNAFLSKQPVPFEKIYFTHGTKRLIYRISLNERVTLFFAHFSLKKNVRAQQLAQMREIVKEISGEVIVLGDFNILGGFQELAPLMLDTELRLLNRENEPTFTFHRMKKTLDLCIATPGIAEHMQLTVVPQPFSDHAALLLDVAL